VFDIVNVMLQVLTCFCQKLY